MTEEELESHAITPELLTNQFEIIVQESGLEQNKAQFLLEQFQDHYKMAAEWAKKAKAIIVTNENQVVTMKQARVGRLFLREKRLEIESARKRLKEAALKEGKAIDLIANFLKDLIIPIETHLDMQEHFIEYKKKAEDERILAEAYAKSEEERIAKEKADAEERERLRGENEKLRKQADIDRIESERKTKINEENLQRIREAAEANLQIERDKLKRSEEELRQKRQAEMKAEADKIRAEERLKSAGDNEKLQDLRNRIELIFDNLPEVNSQEAKNMVSQIKGNLGKSILLIQTVIQEEEI